VNGMKKMKDVTVVLQPDSAIGQDGGKA